eukprot:gene18133-biopygen8385
MKDGGIFSQSCMLSACGSHRSTNATGSCPYALGEQDTGAGMARTVSIFFFWLGVTQAWRGHVLFPLEPWNWIVSPVFLVAPVFPVIPGSPAGGSGGGVAARAPDNLTMKQLRGGTPPLGRVPFS